MNEDITREELSAYLDDALSETESAHIEKLLRNSSSLRERLEEVRQTHDRGEHSIGGIWRRESISCPTREQLTQYLHGVVESGYHDFIQFHLETISCSNCLANLDDLREKNADDDPQTQSRRKRLFESSMHMVKALPDPDSASQS